MQPEAILFLSLLVIFPLLVILISVIRDPKQFKNVLRSAVKTVLYGSSPHWRHVRKVGFPAMIVVTVIGILYYTAKEDPHPNFILLLGMSWFAVFSGTRHFFHNR